jgi:Ca2+-binding EF-hand superfamily protein
MEARLMKALLLSAVAAAAALAVTPVLAQSAPDSHHAMQPMTRAGIAQMVQTHFAKLDANKDGFITQAEMDAGMTARHERMAQRKEQRGDKMFDRMDANHDGSITRQEFDSAHQAMVGRMGQHGGMGMRGMGMMHGAGMGAHMFEMADANKDGRVSLEEATNAALAHFDKADANHDGTVSPDEMRAAHQAMRGKQGR